MKTRLINYSILVVFLFAGSCTKDLELKPVSEISGTSFWKTENDATGALYGMYARVRGDMAFNYFFWGEARSEVIGVSPIGSAGYDLYFNNVLTEDNVNPVYPNINTTWLGLYSAIHDANLILKYVPDISFTSEEKKNSILAQAYAMRAFIYFIMAKTWGDVVLVTDPTEGYDKSIQRERTSVDQVFTQIKSDVNTAVSLFADNVYPPGRYLWSKPAVQTLKGDIYLWTAKRMGGGDADVTEALAALNDAATSDLELQTDFASIFSYANKGNKEIIMSIRLQDLEGPTNVYNFMTIGAIGQFTPANITQESKDILTGLGGFAYMVPSEIVRNQFTMDDQRKNVTFHDVYTEDELGNETYYISIVNKFRGAPGIGSKDDIIIYRYADLLLMIAEAKNALGQDPSQEINLVRQRAYGANFAAHEFVNGTEEANDEAILKERLLELAYEGKRWWDLIRFDKAFDIVPSLQNRQADQYLLLFPISESTLSIEPMVQQNPGF